MKKLNKEEYLRACALYDTIPTFPAVDRAFYSTPINPVIDAWLCVNSAHHHQQTCTLRTARTIKNSTSSSGDHARNTWYCHPKLGFREWGRNQTCKVHSVHDRCLLMNCMLQLFVKSENAPASIQKCKWWPSSTCWMRCTHNQLPWTDAPRMQQNGWNCQTALCVASLASKYWVLNSSTRISKW